MRMGKKRVEPEQLSLARTAGHGGWREGAGRKKAKSLGRRDVSHAARPKLTRHTPVHVTLRAVAGRPSLRTPLVRSMFTELVRELNGDAFQIVAFSIQRDHVHMICEAVDEQALSTAMRRLTIRSSLRLNALFGRVSGRNWDGGYHRHDLTTPREVRNALVYVLMNWRKHGEAITADRDPYSSADEFDGWDDGRRTAPKICGAPRSWLLATGWRRGGLLSPAEAPRARKLDSGDSGEDGASPSGTERLVPIRGAQSACAPRSFVRHASRTRGGDGGKIGSATGGDAARGGLGRRRDDGGMRGR